MSVPEEDKRARIVQSRASLMHAAAPLIYSWSKQFCPAPNLSFGSTGISTCVSVLAVKVAVQPCRTASVWYLPAGTRTRWFCNAELLVQLEKAFLVSYFF